MFYSGNDKNRRRRVVQIVKQDLHKQSEDIMQSLISIRIHETFILVYTLNSLIHPSNRLKGKKQKEHVYANVEEVIKKHVIHTSFSSLEEEWH